MTPKARKAYLASLRDEIVSLRAVKCRMAHERVVGSTAPQSASVSREPIHNFKRVGLCSPLERGERLGCSHTMSRTKLDRAIDELGPEKAGPLRRELNWLTNEIHLLDHQKGAAEGRLAAARHGAGGGCGEVRTLELIKATEEVERLGQEHDEYVGRVGVLRDRVVSELERISGELER
jgi:hypothetical protein